MHGTNFLLSRGRSLNKTQRRSNSLTLPEYKARVGLVDLPDFYWPAVESGRCLRPTLDGGKCQPMIFARQSRTRRDGSAKRAAPLPDTAITGPPGGK